jgi:hypothetical protein
LLSDLPGLGGGFRIVRAIDWFLGKEDKMKRTVFVLTLALVFGLTLYAVEGSAQMGPGMMGPGYGMGPGMMGPWGGYGGWTCPWCGQQMGAGSGYGMGPGMMGGGMMGPGMMGPGSGPQYQQPQRALTEEEAKQVLGNYLNSMRNPNLKLGNIKDMGNSYEAEILTKDDSLVDRVLVDKYTGGMRSVY